ncbi:hypothetical protein [Roseococcus pinisoli]|uniref:HTH cro/C1-type domain-containing protein n=1 Tax=Roseococcus pinisoli TaxID=2835040 RepID=A0ABS5QD74_9PROT|nr:hypothetical protein [Roseococcus pinisoli]MBS7810543.1 hypothetical protein [Roseococcus pinisoli]
MSSTITVPRALYDMFGGELEARVAAFVTALEAHQLTVGEPAPVEHEVVEALARSGAEIEIEEPPATNQPEPDPFPPLTARQLRLWLLARGITRAMVEAALANLPEPDREVAEIEWEYSTQYLRSHRLIDLFGALFDLSPADIDAGWPEAAAL